ncbi:MAG TPA: hypothetical protein VKX46_04985, partial [Ktedonobacteraceae bacterium]|nr:hypothetical protein [Ktedonobacteraceae bacterium]
MAPRRSGERVVNLRRAPAHASHGYVYAGWSISVQFRFAGKQIATAARRLPGVNVGEVVHKGDQIRGRRFEPRHRVAMLFTGHGDVFRASVRR